MDLLRLLKLPSILVWLIIGMINNVYTDRMQETMK